MTPADWTLVKSLFARAIELPASQRSSWMDSLTSLPPPVQEELRRLLEHVSHPAPRSAPLPGPVLAGGEDLAARFRILRLLGRGGMGEVYLAHDSALDLEVALKTIRSDFSSERSFVSRLEEEVRATRKVQHRGACKLFDLHRDAGTGLSFITMQYLEGMRLSDRLAAGPLPLEETGSLAGALAECLDAIHAAGVVHRDLKPGNIFLTPEPVIADFGLALETSRPITETLTEFGPNAIVGTPAYMAPEQLLGQGAGPAADIHAFGVILYECLTGTMPFPGETALAVALNRLSGAPLPIHPSIPAAWLRAIHACLQRDPAGRPRTAAAVLALTRRRFILPPLSRRSLVLGGATLALSAGIALFRNRPRVHVPAPEAVRRLKLGQEFSQRTASADILASIREFRLAVEADPGYAEAWAHLADAYCAAANFAALPGKAARLEAEAAARRALAIQPGLALARSSLAFVLSTDFSRWEQAGAFFAQAIADSPNEPALRARYAAYLGRRENFEQAVAMARSAVDLEPGKFRFLMQLAAEFVRARRFAELLELMLKVVELHPNNAEGFLTLCRAYEWNRRFGDGDQALRTAEALRGDADTTAYRATLRQAQGRTAEARVLADRYFELWRKGKYESNTAAGVEAALGRTEHVFSIIEEALRREDDTLLAIPSNPYLAYLRSDPRMLELRRRLRLPV